MWYVDENCKIQVVLYSACSAYLCVFQIKCKEQKSISHMHEILQLLKIVILHARPFEC